MRCDQKAANVAIARFIPLIIGGIIGYASWAVTKQLCIDYLLNPSPSHLQKRRVGAAAGVLAVYYILLFPVLACYFRLLHEIIFNPGFVPLGPQWAEQQTEADKSTRKRRRSRSGKTNNIAGEKGGDLASTEPGLSGGNDLESGLSAEASLESFYTKNFFICQQDGMPIWCSTCGQFKPDRARHCREVGRCVRKMDHFCPWVGGVVCETSFKFFIQFLGYTTIFCGFTLAIMAVYVAELRQKTGKYNVHWLVALGLGTLFCLFTLGMNVSSLQFAMVNSTTVENLNRRKKVWTLAISVPHHMMESYPQLVSTLQTVSYPFPGEFTTPPNSSQSEQPQERRVFAIVDTRPGENPFDLGSRLANVKEVMGYTLLEWLLPLKHSPCTDHSSKESAYALGPAVQRLRKETGLDDTPQQRKDDDIGSSDRRKRRKRRRRESNRPTSDVTEDEIKIQEPAAVHHRPSN